MSALVLVDSDVRAAAQTALQLKFAKELKAIVGAREFELRKMRRPDAAPFDFLSVIELRAWRLFGADVMPVLEQLLAAQGETPDQKILSLQHSLADLLRSSTPNTRSDLHDERCCTDGGA